MDRLSKIKLIGIIVIFLLGALDHFIYEWSGYNPWIGFVSGVNESVWEHWKLGFWATIAFMIPEFFILKGSVMNYFIGRGLGMIGLQFMVTIPFYLYTSIFDVEILLVDIILFFITVIVSQYIAFKVFSFKNWDNNFELYGLGILVLMAWTLMYFTFNTPQLDIFHEEHSGRYGTEWEYHPEENHDQFD